MSDKFVDYIQELTDSKVLTPSQALELTRLHNKAIASCEKEKSQNKLFSPCWGGTHTR